MSRAVLFVAVIALGTLAGGCGASPAGGSDTQPREGVEPPASAPQRPEPQRAPGVVPPGGPN